jgi:hypothetical protein
MDTTILTGMAGVLGSLVGGSATVATAWITQRTLNRRELLAGETSKRESLYGEFINECSARALHSFENTLDKSETLLSIYALLNRIRICAVRRRSPRSGTGAGIDHGTVLLAKPFVRTNARVGA